MHKVLERQDLRVIASPMRRQILEALAEPDSAVNLARRLGMSRQRIGYHMRELEKADFLELTRTRRRRGCTERLYRARQTTYLMEPDIPAAGEAQDRFSWAALVQLAGRVLRELAELSKRADDTSKRLPTMSLETTVAFANPADRKAFAEEITEAVHRLAEKYHAGSDPNAREYRFFAGAYPKVKSEEK